MKYLKFLSLLLVSIFCFAGVFAQRKQVVKKNLPVVAENKTIKNGIKLKSSGFKISDAYLVFDDETIVPEDNKVELNQHVNMLLIIDEGWTVTGGRVFPGSKQLIRLSNGAEILNSEELFAAFDETGVPPEDARYITLNAVITELKDKKNHVIVNFRVWDKKGNAEITGSYKLFIR
ncbi:MAG: hypothetical protein H7Z13_05550 [Ferruginibacter sp.]|nr:hypothetical protein [Ferruginibacter sp.]